jgi:hypothetical protein
MLFKDGQLAATKVGAHEQGPARGLHRPATGLIPLGKPPDGPGTEQRWAQFSSIFFLS